MPRGSRPAKAKIKPRPPIVRQSPQNQGSARLELEERLAEAVKQQAATAEILGVISRSPTDVQPVFDTIAASAVSLCDGVFGSVFRFDGELVTLAAQFDTLEERERAAWRSLFPMRPDHGTFFGKAILTRAVVQVGDIGEDRRFPEIQRAYGYRSALVVPMLRDGVAIGAIGVFRQEPTAFSDSQVLLLKAFADQAAIGVENVRLFKEAEARNRELSESLEQQTSTSEILRVISSSPTDVQPVFEAIAQSAARLCESEFAWVFRFDGQLVHFTAHHGLPPGAIEAARRTFPVAPHRGFTAGRSVLSSAVEHIPDIHADPDYTFGSVVAEANIRGSLAVPMLHQGLPIGAITVTRIRSGPFSDRQIALLQTFAEQAVIAIENVRLFAEAQARNRELTETLEQQTATSEILRAILRSPTDMQPVLDIVAQSAADLCKAPDAAIFRRDGDRLRLVAHHGSIPYGTIGEFTVSLARGVVNGRAVLEGRTLHVTDLRAEVDEFPEGSESARQWGHRTVLSVPLKREGIAIGCITLRRTEVHPFSEEQISLLGTFANQAAIAIENIRLFQELEVRNRDLTETLEQQTATAEILRIISSSPTDVQPVLDALVKSATRFCGASDAVIFLCEEDSLRVGAHYGPIPQTVGSVRPLMRGTVAGRSLLERRAVHVADLQAEAQQFPQGSVYARQLGHRTILSVPLVRESAAIGVIQLRRAEVNPFSDKQIDLLQTFANQAVIAIENVRLFQELQERTQELTRSVEELRALGEVSQAVSSTLDLEAVLETIVKRAVELSGSNNGIVYEFEEASQTFHARATHRITPEHLATLRAAPIQLGEGAVGRAGVTQEPVQVANIQEEWQVVAPQVRELHAREGTRSLLAVPLIREGRLLGGLVILRRERGAFSPEVVATLQTFAAQSVLAIHNARLFRESQRQKQYSEALVNTSPVAIVTMDLAGTVVGWNPGAARLFGYAEGEALGRQVSDLVATQEMHEEVQAHLRQARGGERIRVITRRARKDGTLVDVETSAMPVVVEGAEVGLIAIYHDITELLQARREAEAATEAKSAFLATMSHEIRTPMNAVIGMSGLLLNTPLTDEQREYAEIVRQSGDTLLSVINDILDFSKIEAGRLELESQPFDVRECVESTLDLVASRAAEKGLDLAYLIGDGTPVAIVGDVTRLRQILLNLLSNAVKFTEAGEVVLAVSARRIDDTPLLHELTFSVRDTGIGIPPDRLDRLFQSFSQVDASTTRRYGGTGLGLAISQRLTELMGGQIGVASEVGSGSEFRFTIRAAVAEVSVPARRDLSGVQPSLRGKRVLVVDDNATNRRILTTHLDAWGMPARATGSPIEALAWIRADEAFDIGILDMHMPEMDGVALAQAIREHPSGAALPLVLFTSLGRREARAESESFAAYLHKPIKPSQLFDALVSVLAEQPVHVAPRGVARRELDPEMARRHPLRILLAEDNVVNQKVALRLLGQMGYRADVAANGLEAIDAVERQTYDVVLMDVQMPELDGFEASREINRRWPGGDRPRLVAMTANAMQGDRELCAAAGMDDYVAKPVRVEELVGALERCGQRPDPGVRGGRAAAGAADTPAGGATDRTVLERLSASMGSAFVGELIDTFNEDAQEQIATLRRALAATDLDAFRRAAHSLKSTSETLGAARLATLARELEAMARAGNMEGAQDRLEWLVGEHETAVRSLRDFRRGLPS